VIRGTAMLVRTIRETKADFIHTHSIYPGLYSGFSAAIAPAPRRIMSFHNLGYSSYPAKTLKQKTLKMATKFAMRHGIDVFVAPSAAVANHYQSELGLKNVHVIPHLADPACSMTPNSDRRPALWQYGINADGFTLGVLGRFVHEKGHRYLLQALTLLRDRQIKPSVLMVGSGPLYSEIEQQVIRLNLQEQVKLHPALAHEQALEVMRACNAIVVPSTHEGFSLVAMEAMLLGKPVLGSATGGLAEIVREGISGFLFRPEDPQALADAIAKIIQNPELAKSLSLTSRDHIMGMCGAESVLPLWRSVFNSKTDH
jgi:glycosyltransferase involved in cell wall biosynthesis